MSYFTAEKLGVALARARVSAGLSQVDMARRINKGKATVQSWECGASSPPADKIMDWFEACGTSPLPAMQEMLHPELYKEPIQRKSDEELDEVLTEYFRTAPRIVKEMVLFILLGRHGSYPPAVFAEVCANLHTPLAEQGIRLRPNTGQLWVRRGYRDRPDPVGSPASGESAAVGIPSGKRGREERRG